MEDSWDPDDDMRLMRSVFGHRYMIKPSRWMQLRKSDCPNTEGGVRAHGTLGMVADLAAPAREEDAWGRAPRLAG